MLMEAQIMITAVGLLMIWVMKKVGFLAASNSVDLGSDYMQVFTL